VTPAQEYGGGDFRSYQDPLSVELEKFPSACGQAAARQSPEGGSPEFVGALHRAAEVLATIAVRKPVRDANLVALGIPRNELERIVAVEFIKPGTVESVAEGFCLKYRLLIELAAKQIAEFERPPGRRTVELL
jgi:hypothetical protein